MFLYQFETSGNCYKIRLLLTQLEKKYVLINLPRDKTRLTEDFLTKSFLGKVPVLETSEIVLTESQAILYYLSKNTQFFPDDILIQSEILKWMSFEQSEVQTSIGVARYYLKFKNKKKKKYIRRTKEILKILSNYLENRTFFVKNIYTIADISLFGYIHLVEEIGISLKKYPNISTWITNVKSQPNYIKMI
jgi:glutathione S-transferase